MKKSLLSILLVFALIIGIMPSRVSANTTDSGSSQTGGYGRFVSGRQVIRDMVKKSGDKAHPRIIMSKEKFQNLSSHVGEKSVTGSLLEDLRSEANRHLGEPVATYDADDEDHLLETSKRIQRRVAALALAYNIFGDEEYAVRAYEELEAACGFKDWSPKHFLDTAEMCTAFAYGYDWLYNWMTPEQKEFLRKNMIQKGLNQVMEDYTDTPHDRKRTYKWYQDQEGDNWQLVCTGGTNLAALAIGDEEGAQEIAADVLDYGYKRAYSFVRRAYSTTDGTYIEGLGYWDYATYYLGLQSSALISATGTDYGLADYEGIRKSVDFVRYMSSNSPKSFSFGDDRDSRNTGWAVFLWLGEYLNSPELSAIRLKNIGHDDDGFRYLDVLWIDESKQTGAGKESATDWGAVGACNASFRNTWDDSGIVTALHVGENYYKYHGHYDLGSFYVESNGARFFTDLGNESYSLKDRQFSYRIKPEGHNTLVINPTDGTDQREGANCLITGFQSGNEAYAVTDLTDAYGPNGANSVVRGLKMIKDKECVIVQDEISLKTPGEIYWFAHTKGTITVASDGRSAIVTVGSDKLWVGLISEGGEFSVMKAEPLTTSLKISGATGNKDYRKLAIHLTNTKDTTISVACIPLKNGKTSPSWTPTLKAISEWSGEAETTHTDHDFSEYVSNGDGTHRVICKQCKKVQEGKDGVACFGGTATCKEKAKCSACGENYGDLAAHKGGTATCKVKAKCSVCGKEYGSLAGHKYATTWTMDTTNHWHVCSVCGAKKDVAAHADANKDEKCDSCSYNMHSHVGNKIAQVDATCTTDGVKAYFVCTCGKYYADLECTKEITDLAAWKIGDGKIEKTGHTYVTEWSLDGTNHWHECSVCGDKNDMAAHTTKTTITRATLTVDGKKETKCSVCGKVTKTETIYAAKTIKLAKTSYVYDGKAKKPTVIIEDSKGNAISATNYSVKYDDDTKNVGKINVKITFKGDYKGSKTLSFTINPKATTLRSVTPAAKAFTTTWSRQTAQVDGYEIRYAQDEKFTDSARKVTIAKNTTTSKKISGLKARKTYYVRVRTYKMVGTKKYYSDWSKVLNVKTK